MAQIPMSKLVKERVDHASEALGTASPIEFVGPLLDRSFPLPAGDEKYALNALMPGYAPAQPRFRTDDGDVLRLTIEPLGPQAPPVTRRNEATREMRRLVAPNFGRDALEWFDDRSREFRGSTSIARLDYGAWFGTAYDANGLRSAAATYELMPWQLQALPPKLGRLVQSALAVLPRLVPVFSTIECERDAGTHQVTFLHRGPLRVADLEPLMLRLGLEHQLPSVMQVIGLALGGRFELPSGCLLIGVGETPHGAELTLEILLGRLPDVPASFLDLLALGLFERPRELRSLSRWLEAFTPDERADGPGEISVMSVRARPRGPVRVQLHLRPVEFEVRRPAPRNGRAPVAAVA